MHGTYLAWLLIVEPSLLVAGRGRCEGGSHGENCLIVYELVFIRGETPGLFRGNKAYSTDYKQLPPDKGREEVAY